MLCHRDEDGWPMELKGRGREHRRRTWNVNGNGWSSRTTSTSSHHDGQLVYMYHPADVSVRVICSTVIVNRVIFSTVIVNRAIANRVVLTDSLLTESLAIVIVNRVIVNLLTNSNSFLPAQSLLVEFLAGIQLSF